MKGQFDWRFNLFRVEQKQRKFPHIVRDTLKNQHVRVNLALSL